MKLSPFETDLLAWIAEHTSDPDVAAQLRAARPIARQHTGVGCFLELKVDDRSCHPVATGRIIDGPHIQAPTLQHGAGSILFVENGFVDTLELFAYGDSFPQALEDYAFSAEPP